MYAPTRRLLVVLAAAVLVSTGLTASPAAAATAKWTVMVYMSGDNNLEEYVVKDLELELGGAGSNADVQIVALADRGPGLRHEPWRLADHQALPRHARA